VRVRVEGELVALRIETEGRNFKIAVAEERSMVKTHFDEEP